MTLLIIAYLAGVLTIATPCIFPVLPFVLARTDEPFTRGALPLLIGLAIAFATVASLASFAGGWAVDANRHGRVVALGLMTLFGLTMLMPNLAARIMAPVGSIGSRLSNWAGRRALTSGTTIATSMLLGVATGFVWAPCAGPVLGLILTGAALKGPSVGTSVLLLAYGVGAATSLAAGALLGGRVLAIVKRSVRWGGGIRRILGAAVVAGAATIWFGLDAGILTRLSSVSTNILEHDLIATLGNPRAVAMTSTALPGSLASLLAARQWLNTPPPSADNLRGKVVLVNFWTYSCINCLRVLPYVRAWAEKYKDRGLVVIGVQTPEFAFEKDTDNIRQALVSLDIKYPVAVDNDFGIWRAFDNEAWPALYFIDIDGRVRDHVFGEGGYEQSERRIQQLLSEADGTPVTTDIAAIDGKGVEAAADEGDLRSAETYLGYSQARDFVSSEVLIKDSPALYRIVSAPPLNHWSLAGVWTIGGEFATLNDPLGGIVYRFHARDLNLILASASQDHPVRFRVTIDGAAPGADHGVDVDADGLGVVRQARLYQLIRQTAPVADRTFRIEFFDAGVRAYTFTFG